MAQRKKVESTEQAVTRESGRGPSENHVTIIGRVATIPVLRSTSNGTPVTSFRIAINGKGDTQFLSVVAWRQRAEFAAEFLGKGRLVHVSGRLQNRSWEAADGSTRQSVEIIADQVQALSAKPAAVSIDA